MRVTGRPGQTSGVGAEEEREPLQELPADVQERAQRLVWIAAIQLRVVQEQVVLRSRALHECAQQRLT